MQYISKLFWFCYNIRNNKLIRKDVFLSIDCSLIYPYLEDANWKNELRSKDNLALGYLTSCLRQEGFSVSMIHAEHNKHSVNDIIKI